MISKLNCLIVGAGSIGAFKPHPFDSSSDSENILTHAHAIYYLEGLFNISCIYDISLEYAQRAGMKWNCPFSDNREKAFTNYPVDVMVVATPDEEHLQVVDEFLSFPGNSNRLKALIIEKPAGNSLEDCVSLDNITSQFKIPVFVNYSRMFCDSIVDLKNIITVKQAGELINVVIRYTRGVRRDGSHAIQLINFLFGHIHYASALRGEIINDHSDNDPTRPLFFNCENCGNIFMVPCDGRHGAVFTFDLWFAKARIVLEDYGKKIITYNVVKDGIYGNYSKMSSVPHRVEDNADFTKNLVNLYKNVYGHLTRGDQVKCSIKDAIKVWRTLTAIEKMRKS